MPRWFNTAGPCNPVDHYMLPAMRRLPEVRSLIEQKSYFVVHAPRQVGKTTALLTLARELTAEGRYASALVSLESGQPFARDVGAAEAAVLSSWRRRLQAQFPPELLPPPFPEAAPGNRIAEALTAWAHSSPRPLVLFLDEIDALQDEALMSVLRQLREGYPDRPSHFPHSLAVIGLRDVRDYKVASREGGRLGTPSPFNVAVRSLTLRNFTAEEVVELYQQHTRDTGQRFTPEALALAFEFTQGQPWLVNSLARVAVEELVRDTAQPVRGEDIARARSILIERQETHLDSLVDRLREPRVRAIIEPMLAGTFPESLPPDDLRFVADLGLIRLTEAGGFEVANPIYREIVVRELAFPVRGALPRIQPTWLREDGRLDEARLCEAFLSFWRQHGEPLLGTAPYHEVAPHLVLMAFLHRVVNGGGSIEREYAIGRGRMDLCVRHGPDTLAMELKVWRDRDGDTDPLAVGLEQLDRYLAGLGLDSGWLVIFDQRSGRGPMATRTRAEQAATPSGRRVTVLRC
jgi:DNA polymerase III delta prime subunit